ncbi:MAG: peptidoglycan-binding protein LysM, partial [Myxococcaceae bacterium]|nr:peptidoglycan-binding protein LysM [Myxococcaceae bacterium]
PAPELPPLATPDAKTPRHHAKLKLGADRFGKLGPLKLRWGSVPGATSYEVTLLPEKEGAKEIVLTSARPEVTVRALEPGRYAWRVRAKAEGNRVSEPSEAWLFEVEPARIKLEVRGTDWK